MKKLLQIITNPFLLPLVPAVVIFLILPLHFDRYVLHVIDERFIGEGRTVRYADITNDGYSERIVTGKEETYTWLKIYDHQGVLFDQWNFRGSQEHIDFPLGPSTAVKMHPGSSKVIAIFTLVQDSLYLHVIDDLQNATPLVENRFIATVGPGRGRPDPIIRPPRAEDVFRDGHSDLMFLIASGFSLYPRRVLSITLLKTVCWSLLNPFITSGDLKRPTLPVMAPMSISLPDRRMPMCRLKHMTSTTTATGSCCLTMSSTMFLTP